MVSVLFVCLGNICRSPAAEAVFKSVVARNKSVDVPSFHIDSCGTGGGDPDWYQEGGTSYHDGDMADSRMIKEAQKRGYSMTSRSRPLVKEDIDEVDHIICMDKHNKTAVLEAADAWGGASCRRVAASKISMMTSYCTTFQNVASVPDPWYTGGFDHVLDLLEDACGGLYDAIVTDTEK
uniref:Phosphotyrosine protein phosphatase I domain-containing protein n=1 Tax=Hyaloperonospora arabidopsidis (strain Emoy2) TaxID=559515 RepID=M4BMI6_HYAAE